MSRLNTYCTMISGNPQCPGCDYCLGSEGGPPVSGYEWVQGAKFNELRRKVYTYDADVVRFPIGRTS